MTHEMARPATQVEQWTVTDADVDAVDHFTYEVLRHRLWQVNEEQASALRRATGSPIVDMGDFNVALATARGDVVYDGSGVLFHASTTQTHFQELLRWAPEAVGIEDGDMFFSNHPFLGAVHQSDAIVSTPIFWEGKLVCWSAAVLHAMDVGGTDPGSFCVNAHNRWEDPIRIAPIKLVERGEIRQDFERLYLGISRLPRLVALDLRAQIAAGHVARARVRDLIERYSVLTVCAVLERSLRDTEEALRSRLRELPDGTFRAVQFVDQAHIGDDRIHKVSLALVKKDDRLVFDLSESDPQAGIIGVPLNLSRAALMVPVLEMLCAGLPRSSSAALRVCEFKTTSGTLPDVTEDAPVSCGTVTGLYSQISVSRQALAQLLATHPRYREFAFAPSMTSPWLMILAGIDEHEQPFVMAPLDMSFGGVGARPYADGVDCGGVTWGPSSRTPDVETAESHYPVLYLYRRCAPDTGGPGQFRGGAGAEVAIAPRTPGGMSVLNVAFGAAFPDNAGIAGGYPSAAQECLITGCGDDPGDATESGSVLLSPKSTAMMNSDEVLHARFTASGGWGDPLERVPDAVARDVFEGLVSREAAARVYGVVMTGTEIDVAATARAREAIRAARLGHPRAGDVFGGLAGDARC